MTAMIVLGLLTAAGAHGVLPETEHTRVLYPWEIAETPVMLSSDGAYAVWACVPGRTASAISINGTSYPITPEQRREQKQEYLWHHAATVDLRAGETAIHCEPGILMIALSRQPGFNPEAALTDMRAMPPTEHAKDRRADAVRDTNTVFTMPPFRTLAEWESTASLLRERVLLGSGLYPMPEKTPLNARIFDETQFDDYRVSKVQFEPWPGFLATGNLYRPLGEGPFPAVINPHGHWKAGRLEDSESCSVAARCITLARMGAVALTYDMIGYVDSKQTSHNWGGNREKLWGIHTFAMQLWTGVRALDLMESLPYVDAERLGCTGASGGGTQTFALTAIDPRVKVAAPVNMISSTMQGGCLCENAPILRLDNANMEIGALAAPRPLLLVSATGDWTRETPRVEYPSIRSIYALYGAEDKIRNVHLDYGHNYNLASREAMYRFFGEHLLGGNFAEFTEPPYEMPSEEVLRVFPGDSPPEGYLCGDELVAAFVEQARQRRAGRIEHYLQGMNAPAPATFAALLGAEIPRADQLRSQRYAMEQREGYVLEKWVIGRAAEGDQIPALFYRGVDAAPQDAVLLVHGRGKAALADLDNGGPGPVIRALIQQGKAVLVIDAFLLGEHQGAEEPRVRLKSGLFHDTFLPTDTGCRVQDVITARAFLAARYDMTGVVDLVGLEEGGLWCLFAGAVDTSFRRVLVDMNQFDLDDDAAWEAQYYVPGLRALGDVPAALVAGAPERFHLFNVHDAVPLAPLNVSVTGERLSVENL